MAMTPLPVHTTRDNPTDPVIRRTPFGDINIPEPEKQHYRKKQPSRLKSSPGSRYSYILISFY
jgi:hypothetical protein